MTKRFNVSVMLVLALSVLMTVFSCTEEKPVEPAPKPEDTTAVKPPTGTPGRQFTLVPDKFGRLEVNNANGTYKAGDILNLKGTFTAVIFYNLKGASGKPITIRNAPGTVLKIGDPAWNGGSWSTALSFRNSHYVKVEGTSKTSFIINGSTTAGRIAYFNMALAEQSDNFEIANLTITGGGTGLWAKTDPVKSIPATHYPNSYMENLFIHDLVITGTHNEGMYIGHTATYWNLETNYSYYTLPAGTVLGSVYVQPIKWRNVKIYNNIVKDGGADGIQTAAIDGLEVYNNEITNWGGQHNPSHSGGLLIGGRVNNSNIHDNYVHDGWGELFQFFGSGENNGKHVITRNLFRDNFVHDGVNFRGTDNAIVEFSHNTVARTYGVCLRFNGYLGMKGTQQIFANALIQPRTVGGVTIEPRSYIYLEGDAVVREGIGTNANTKFATVAAAGVDVNNYYQPLANSPLGSSGYRR